MKEKINQTVVDRKPRKKIDKTKGAAASTDSSWERSHSQKNLLIGVVGIVISFIVGAVAIYVFFETQEQTRLARISSKASVDAVDVAKNTFQETKKFNDSSLIALKASAKSTLEDSKKRFVMDSTNLNFQLQSLQQAQNRFDAEHTEFLEVKDFRVNFTNTAKNPVFNYILSNFGGTVLISSVKYGYQIGPAQDSVLLRDDAINRMRKSNYLFERIYVSPQAPRAKNIVVDVNLAKFKNTIKESFIVYFCGELKFISLVTGKKKMLSFLIATNSLEETNFYILKMDNYPIK